MVRIDGRPLFALSSGAEPREPILTVVPTLDAIADDPGKAAEVPPATARALYLRAVIVLNALLPLVLAPNSVTAQPAPPEPDRYLEANEVCAALGVTKAWLYRHASRLPFAKRLTRKTLRFSESGLRKYQAAKRP
jgi:predicted DNA-binding transcriptional regulator AlpA